MEIGIVEIMPAYGYPGITDTQIYQDEIALGVAADRLGFDHLWVVEHHFENYSLCPDNFVYLAHLAALTKNIKLATGAVIVPWNLQPLRIAEKAALLDQLSGGRALLGLGRGLARREFSQMGVAMDESRERFDESSPLIIEALETGWFPEHKGKFFTQPKAPIRPAPVNNNWRDSRVTQVAMSPDSCEQAAKLGIQMMAFNYKPPEVQRKEIEDYQAAFRRYHGKEPRPVLLTEMTVCDTNAARAREHAEQYCANYCISVLNHYELLGEQFDGSTGYKNYAAAAEAMRSMGKEAIVKAYVEQQIWGTPDQMLRKFEERFKVMGPYGVLTAFRFGGAPLDVAMRGMELFAKEVMPVLRSWDQASKSQVTARAA